MAKDRIRVNSQEVDVVDVVELGETPTTIRATAWPVEPQRLTLTRKEEALWIAYDVALIVLPVLLILKIGLCIFAAHLDRDNVGASIDSASVLSRLLVSLNAQLVTLFTIVFVTIMSTFVKRYALWKAQRGAYLAELEQFQGSVSLPSTLKLIWSLRSFGTKSMLLVLVWSFYYLGSQAVKNEYRLTDSGSYKNMKAAVQRFDAPSGFDPGLESFFARNNDTGFSLSGNGLKSLDFYDQLNLQFASTILGVPGNNPWQEPNYGTNQGPLVPFFDAAVAAAGKGSLIDQAWRRALGLVDVSKQSKLQGNFTNYQGLPLWLDSPGPNNTHNSYASNVLGGYTLSNASYIHVKCGGLQIEAGSKFPNTTNDNATISMTMNHIRPDAPRDALGHPLREMAFFYRMSTPTDMSNNSSPQITIAAYGTCNFTTKYVDLQVKCISTGCYPHKMRWANNTEELHATSYSTPFDSDTFASAFLSNFTLSTGAQDDFNLPSIVVNNFVSLESTDFDPTTYKSVFDIPSDKIFGPSRSLTTGFNTYYTLSQSVLSTQVGPNMTKVLSQGRDGLFQLADLDGAELIPQYRIYWQWVPLDFIACSILLAAAILSYWLRVNTLAPDIFGYVSSLTRDNPNIQLPSEGSSLNGIERARRLKHVKVAIGDLQGNVADGDIGRIGLAPAACHVHDLHKERKYV